MAAQRISRADVARYADSVTRIAEAPKARLLAALQSLEWEDVTRDANDAVALMKAACASGSDMAAVSSAEFYKALRRDALGGQWATLAVSGHDGKATEGAVRAFVEHVMHGERDVFERQCLDRYEYEVRNAARHCIAENARRDTARVGYALVPSSGGCCAYCSELASLGFVEQWADWDGTVHEHCNCTTVPGFEGETEIAGYDPDDYIEHEGETVIDGKYYPYEMPF